MWRVKELLRRCLLNHLALVHEDHTVGYRLGKWDAQINVFNLTDANYASIAVAKFLIYGGDSRKIRVTLTRVF